MKEVKIYKTKPIYVQAVRWYPPENWQDSLGPHNHGITVLADDCGMVHSTGRRLHIKPGEWIVWRGPDKLIMSDKDFRLEYEKH